MKNEIRFYYIYERSEKVPYTGIMPIGSKVSALQGFKKFLDEQKVVPELYELRQYSSYVDDDMVLRCASDDDYAQCICSGDDVDTALQVAIDEAVAIAKSEE